MLGTRTGDGMMRDTLRRLGEAMANSERLRSA
jgi:hypothetical protein